MGTPLVSPLLVVNILYVIPAILCLLIVAIFKKRLRKDLEKDGFNLSEIEENKTFMILILVPAINLCFALSFLVNFLVSSFFPNFFMDKE